MLAEELIDNAIPFLSPADTIQKALNRMAEFKVKHLPLVEESQYLGLIAEEELTDPDHLKQLNQLHLSLLSPYALEEMHVYEVTGLFYESGATVMPVLSQAKSYLGLISINAMVPTLAELTSAAEPGGIIVLEVTAVNNSLAYMAQVVESDNAHILSAYTRSFTDSTRQEVTLKINKQDLSSISAAFIRYGYDVKAVFGQNDGGDDTMDRYDSLMNYLNF